MCETSEPTFIMFLAINYDLRQFTYAYFSDEGTLHRVRSVLVIRSRTCHATSYSLPLFLSQVESRWASLDSGKIVESKCNWWTWTTLGDFSDNDLRDERSLGKSRIDVTPAYPLSSDKFIVEETSYEISAIGFQHIFSSFRARPVPGSIRNEKIRHAVVYHLTT
jgi:hypothetical protein